MAVSLIQLRSKMPSLSINIAFLLHKLGNAIYLGFIKAAQHTQLGLHAAYTRPQSDCSFIYSRTKMPFGERLNAGYDGLKTQSG